MVPRPPIPCNIRRPRPTWRIGNYFWAQAETFDTGLFIEPYLASRLDGSEISAFSMRINSDGGQFGVAAASIAGSQLDDILALQTCPRAIAFRSRSPMAPAWPASRCKPIAAGKTG
jgi:hypothetical protein